jgi:hypothetical protein
MLSTYQGYIANGAFVISEPIKKLPERKRAILTILNEENLEDENDMDAPDWAKKAGITFSEFQQDVNSTIKRIRLEKRAKSV